MHWLLGVTTGIIYACYMPMGMTVKVYEGFTLKNNPYQNRNNHIGKQLENKGISLSLKILSISALIWNIHNTYPTRQFGMVWFCKSR